MELGSIYKVKVERIVKSGIVVKLEDGSTELIHVSKLSNDYVKNIEDFVSVGDVFDAKCVEGKQKDTELSLKHLNLHSKVQKEHKNTNRYINTKKDNKIKHPSQEEYARMSKSPDVYEPKKHDSRDINKMIERAQKDYQDKAKQMKNRSMNKRSGGYPAAKRKPKG